MRLVRSLRGLIARHTSVRTRWVLATAAFAAAVASATLSLARWALPASAVGLAVALVALVGVLVVVPRAARPVPKPRPAPQVRSARQRLLADYAGMTRRRGRQALISTLQRTGSMSGREILAYLATGGRHDLSGLLSLMEEFRDPALRPIARDALAGSRSEWLLELARLLVVQPGRPRDAFDGVALYRYVIDASGSPLMGEHRQLFAEALLAAGEPQAARDEIARWGDPAAEELLLIADSINPFVAGRTETPDTDAWSAAVNRMFALDGLEGIDLLPGDPDRAFDRIHCAVDDAIDDGPLVSIIVSSYLPGAELTTAVGSCLASTWRNLEVIVVDDGSGVDSDAVYAAVAALDDRVRVLRLPVNGGTYRARNAALDTARGELVTFQDSDDWMHPRRIERQVRHLLDNPELPANASLSVRVTADLEFASYRSFAAKVCEPSLLFWRERVVGSIGYFDRVRKSADSEYRRRIGAAFQTPVPVIGVAPLTWQRTAAGSLSHDDIGRVWISPARRAYRDAANRWRRQILYEGADPYLPSAEDAPRAFYAPPEIREKPGPRHFDVLFASNWLAMGSEGGSQRSNEEEIRALTAAGLTVGILNLEAFWFMHWRASRFSARARDLLQSGVAELVQLDSDVSADLVIVRYPPVLQFLDAERSRIDARRVLIVGNQAPYEFDGSARRYLVAECTDRARAVFGLEPTWVPQGPVIRDLYRELVPARLLADYDWPPIVDPADWSVEREPRAGRRPVIGRYSRDAEAKWPADPEVLRQIYASDDVDTKIMGGPSTLAKVLGPSDGWPSTWEVWPSSFMPTREFLALIDFFVYFPHPSMREAFGRSVVEALASGAIAILPPSFEPVFGDAAVYCEPQDVRRAVLELFGDAAAFDRQVERGRAFGVVTGHQAYVDRIRHVIGS